MINEQTAQVAAEWWGNLLEQGDKEKFVQELGKLILANLDLFGKCSLRCDCDPDDILLEALHHTGIECKGILFSAQGIFPNKCTTLIRTGIILAKLGYGSPFEEIPVGEDLSEIGVLSD